MLRLVKHKGKFREGIEGPFYLNTNCLRTASRLIFDVQFGTILEVQTEEFRHLMPAGSSCTSRKT